MTKCQLKYILTIKWHYFQNRVYFIFLQYFQCFKLKRSSWKFSLLWWRSITQCKHWTMWLWNIKIVRPLSQTYHDRTLLRITSNKKLRKLLTKGSNYREPKSINFSKAYFEINLALKACIETLSTKNKLETSTLTPWKESVLTMVKKKYLKT